MERNERVTTSIVEQMQERGIVLGDGGYLIELERRGYVDSGSGREKVGTGKGSGQFTPEVAIEHPAALRGLHEEFKLAGSDVLQALTFFATREKLTRAGYGEDTETINRAAVRIAREVAGDTGLVAGSVARTQLFEREGPSAAGHARDLLAEQVRFLQDAGADFLILETFFRLDEMLIAIDVAKESGLPLIATMSFRPLTSASSDDKTPAECAKAMADAGADGQHHAGDRHDGAGVRRQAQPPPPPREPVSQITLPGFPPPVVEPPPAPVTDPPGCDPTAAPAKHSEAEPAATGQVSSTGQTATSASSEADAPKLDIMRDESHSTRRQKRGE